MFYDFESSSSSTGFQVLRNLVDEHIMLVYSNTDC